MPSPTPAVAATRRAVMAALEAAGLVSSAGAAASGGSDADRLVLVACSGGADSLALAAATAFLTARPEGLPGHQLRAGAVIVDHGWFADSGQVAARAATACRGLGLDPIEVVRVDTTGHPGGPEAAARTARYAAIAEAAERLGAARVLLGHTLDDQAETVLLGLARGAGARSLAGMPASRGVLLRPLLGLRRAETEAACAALGLTPWQDPANHDDRYLRARARQLLPQLDDALGPGIIDALARSAAMLAEDADALDALAAQTYAAVVQLAAGDAERHVTATVDELAILPDAVRRRVLRRMAIAAGAPAGSLSRDHVVRVDRLITGWRGQGPVALPGRLSARRRAGRLELS